MAFRDNEAIALKEFDMFLADEIIYVRMTEEDRLAINKMMRHKCTDFKHEVRKGIIAMLNIQVERKTLEPDRKDYLKILTSENKRRKQQITLASNTVKDATSGAPMGIGVASNAISTTTSFIGNTLLDEAESQRKADEAEKQYVSSQFMHYIPPEEHESIADQVANILSYRFQFLIFRLAGSEDGYKRLAKFFIQSMNAYAIQRLREHKKEYVKALIDAAVPPAPNARRYREWLEFDFDNFRARLRFGYRKRLDLDEEATQIVGRCGPAVRALLGGYRSWIDPKTCQEKNFSPYTIRGALHYASILNGRGEIMSGLESDHRPNEVLRGDNKYPMILLSRNETTADTNIFTTLTLATLQDAHVIALKRLVPDFFSHNAIYVSFERRNRTELVKPAPDECKYPEERGEIPWSDVREAAWKSRLIALYQGSQHGGTKAQIVTISNFSKLIAMRDSGHDFDAQQAKVDVSFAMREAISKYTAVFEITDSSQRAQVCLNVVTAAKYLANSAKMYLLSLNKCDSINEQDRLLALQSINFARIALTSSFDLPLLDGRRYSRLSQASMRIGIEARNVNELQFLSYNNLQILLESLEYLTETHPFATQANTILFDRIKRIKSQFKDNAQELEKSIKLAKLITLRSAQLTPDSPSEFEIQLTEFHDRVTEILMIITSVAELDDVQTLREKLDIYWIESNCLVFEINAALSLDDYVYEEESDQIQEEKIVAAKRTAKEAVDEMKAIADQADRLIANQTLVQRYFVDRQLKLALCGFLQQTKAHRDRCTSILANIKLKPFEIDPQNSEEIAHKEKAQFLLNWLKVHRRFGMISLLSKKYPSVQIQLALSDLEARINCLYKSNVKRTERAVDTIFREVSVEQFNKTDVDSLRRYTQKAEKIAKEKVFLEQAIDADLDVMSGVVSQTQWVVSNINHVRQDKDELNESILQLLDNLSASVSELDVVPSPNGKSAEAINQLLKLFSASHEAPDVDEIKEDPQLDKLHEYSYVYHVLNQIISNTAMNSSVALISESSIKARIGLYLSSLKCNGSSDSDSADNWGVWLIANIIQWTTQEILTHAEQGLQACYERALQELEDMKEILGEESIELSNARRPALQEIRTAYQQMEQILRVQSKSKKTLGTHSVSEADIVSNALHWAARPTYIEQEWLGDRFSKNKSKFMFSENHRSPMILLTFLMVTYFTDKVDELRKEIGKLHQLALLQKKCARLSFKINNATAFKEGKKLCAIESKISKIKLIDRIIATKCKSLEKEKTDMLATRDNILAQRLRIYFNEWKKKTHNPQSFGQLFKAIKRADLEQCSQSKTSSYPVKSRASSAQEPEEKDSGEELTGKKDVLMFDVTHINYPAENYTVEDIEELLNSLLEELEGMRLNMTQQINTNSTSRLNFYSAQERSSNGSFTSPRSPTSKRTPPPVQTVDKLTLNR